MLFLAIDSVHTFRNQVIEMGVAPLTTTSSDPLEKTLLSVPIVLFYVGVEVLVPKKGILGRIFQDKMLQPALILLENY